ncbi:hypothetical protein [Streptomyces sp. NPDC002845]
MKTPCPACRARARQPRHYLCDQCWGNLPGPTRRALNRRDSKATTRLQELHRQLAAGMHLADIQVTP